jgi:hypothetical protein
MNKQIIQGVVVEIGDIDDIPSIIIQTEKSEILKITQNILYNRVKVTFEDAEDEPETN